MGKIVKQENKTHFHSKNFKMQKLTFCLQKKPIHLFPKKSSRPLKNGGGPKKKPYKTS
jgi:hypothetical protein